MNFLRSIFPKSGFLNTVLKMLSANLIVQIISFLLAIIITRLYTDNDFGVFAKFMSVANIFIIMASARLEYAVILPKNDKEAHTLVSLGIIFSFFTALISFFVLYFFSDALNTYFKLDSFQDWIFLLPAVVFFSGFFIMLANFKNRQKQYNQLIAGQSILGISNPLSSIAYHNVFANGLIYGVLSANILGSVFLGFQFVKNRTYAKTVDFKNTLLKYYRFPTYNLLHALLNSISANLPVFMLSVVFENYLIGLFTMALGKVFKPINLFGNSIYQVLSKKIVDDLHHKVVVVNQFVKILKTLFLLGFIPFLILYFNAEEIFSFVFGTHWAAAGFYLKPLLPWLFLSYLTSSFSFIPNLLKQQKAALLLEAVHLVLRFFALYYGIYKMDLSLALSLYSWVGVFVLSITLVWYYNLLKNIKEINF